MFSDHTSGSILVWLFLFFFIVSPQSSAAEPNGLLPDKTYIKSIDRTRTVSVSWSWQRDHDQKKAQERADALMKFAGTAVIAYFVIDVFSNFLDSYNYDNHFPNIQYSSDNRNILFNWKKEF